MAKYEKRTVKKIKPEKPKQKSETRRIEMKPEKSVKLPKRANVSAEEKAAARKNKRAEVKSKIQKLSVVKGYKDVNRTKTIIWVGSVLLVIGLVIFAAAMTPTGLGEYISNSFAAMEKGEGYPQKLSGDDTVHAETNGQISYVLSKTFLETYNSTGYNLINDQHGFSNPVLKTSAARALVFDRGGTGCKVYNFEECLHEKVLSGKIVAANIGRDGSMAFVINSSEYSSTVEVYNKDFVRQYSWSAANETISAVALAENGSKVAVATFKSVNGEFLSSVYIFDFKSATPIFTKQVAGDGIVSLYSDKGAVWAVSLNGATRIAWKDHAALEVNMPGAVSVVSHSRRMMAIAGPSATNTLDTSIALYDKEGLAVMNITVTGEADDICIGKEYLYVLISDAVEAYDFTGALISRTEVGYDVKYLTEPSSGSFGAVTTAGITTYKVK